VFYKKFSFFLAITNFSILQVVLFSIFELQVELQFPMILFSVFRIIHCFEVTDTSKTFQMIKNISPDSAYLNSLHKSQLRNRPFSLCQLQFGDAC